MLGVTVLFNIVFTLKIQIDLMKKSCKRKKAVKRSNKVKQQRIVAIHAQNRSRKIPKQEAFFEKVDLSTTVTQSMK